MKFIDSGVVIFISALMFIAFNNYLEHVERMERNKPRNDSVICADSHVGIGTSIPVNTWVRR